MSVDAFASYSHYVDHLKPFWEIVEQGRFYVGPAAGVKGDTTRALGPGPAVLVAGYPDMTKTRHREHILVEHGVGENWGQTDPHYSGGPGRSSVILFLCPNQRVADANERYDAPCVVVGSPRLEYLRSLPLMPRHDRLRVVVSFHWDNPTWPQTRSALGHFQQFLGSWNADSRIELMGHAHPRHIDQAEKVFARAGIQTLRSFSDVVTWADVYACDNSSTLFEAAACGIKIIYLDAPWYAPFPDSLRFDHYIDLAPHVSGGELVEVALSLDAEQVSYERMVTEVFGTVDLKLAAQAIHAVTNDLSWPPSRNTPAPHGGNHSQPSLFGLG